MVIEVGNFAPGIPHIGTQHLRVTLAGHHRVRVVVNHHAFFTPERGHWHR